MVGYRVSGTLSGHDHGHNHGHNHGHGHGHGRDYGHGSARRAGPCGCDMASPRGDVCAGWARGTTPGGAGTAVLDGKGRWAVATEQGP